VTFTGKKYDLLNRDRISAKLFMWTGNSATQTRERKQEEKVGFEVLMVVTLKITFFWFVMPYNLVQSYLTSVHRATSHKSEISVNIS
jgi:hypothetical protein